MFGLVSLLMCCSVFSNPLIPREELFRLPTCIAIKISPDGQRLAYAGANKEGAINLHVSPDLSLEAAQCYTDFKNPEIKGFYWSSDSKKIIFLRDQNGTGQLRLYCLDLDSLKLKDLTADYDRINAKIFHVSTTENKMVIGINNRNLKFHDLYGVDLDTESLYLIDQNDQFINFLFDDSLNVILKTSLNEDGSLTFKDKNDEILFTVCAEDAFHTECLRYDDKENSIYLLDNRGCNTTQLKKISLDRKKQEVVLGHDQRSDIHEVLFDNGRPIAYSTYFMQKEWHPLDQKAKDDITFLVSKIGSNFAVTHQPPDGKLWVLKNSIPEQGTELWLYNRSSQQLSLLYSFPTIGRLANMYPLVITSNDGMQLVSYLTLPKKMDPGGKPKPLPLVVIPHGGPFKTRDFYEYSPFHQWLADRGYAVLSVNFRLSSGFGKDFVNAGNKQWGRKAHQDISDAVKWCIDSGIAEEGKIAIFGNSYGGYEALCGLAFSPGTFACAIAVCAPSNLKTVLENLPFYWEFPDSLLSDKMRLFTKNAFIRSMGGNPSNEDDISFLESCSPCNYVNQIENPLLLVHGVNDSIVAASESDQVFNKMKQKGLPVVYLSFPDEGHEISKFANTLCYLAYSEWFLAQFLGGGYEPLSEEQRQLSSANISSHGILHENVIKPKAPL